MADIDKELIALKLLTAELVRLGQQKGAAADTQALVQKATVIVLKLKGSTRQTVLKVEETKQNTKEASRRLDHTYLQLQNLLYERDYFRGEVRAAEDFRSQYSAADMELIPEEQFVAQAPKELQEGQNSPHERMKQRLKHERTLRIEETKQLDAKRAHRDAKAKEAEAKHAFLDGLAQHLKAAGNEVDAACLKLGIPPATPSPQSLRTASLLPQPLFTLYWQLLSASSAFDLGLHVSITGDLDAAQKISIAGSTEKERHTEAEHGAEEGEELPEADRELPESKRRRTDAPAPRDDSPFQEHPLRVEVHLQDATQRVQQAHASFCYLPQLRIVSVHAASQADAQVLDSVLPMDTGTVWPSEASRQLLPDADDSLLEELQSKPYRWAQWLAGQDLLPVQPGGTDESHVLQQDNLAALQTYRSQERACVFVQRWRAALDAHSALQAQLQSLSQQKLPLSFPVGPFKQQPPAKIHLWQCLSAPKSAGLPAESTAPVAESATGVGESAAGAHEAAAAADVSAPDRMEVDEAAEDEEGQLPDASPERAEAAPAAALEADTQPEAVTWQHLQQEQELLQPAPANASFAKHRLVIHHAGWELDATQFVAWILELAGFESRASELLSSIPKYADIDKSVLKASVIAVHAIPTRETILCMGDDCASDHCVTRTRARWYFANSVLGLSGQAITVHATLKEAITVKAITVHATFEQEPFAQVMPVQQFSVHVPIMQVDIYTPYPVFKPKIKIHSLRATSRASASASKAPAPDTAELEHAANDEIVACVPEGAANQLLSFQVVQLMQSLGEKLPG
ncbi:hypothetical protein MMC29_003321 [Sticta canariensis]|nr:hypothetical protein [Sticta canariensis]